MGAKVMSIFDPGQKCIGIDIGAMTGRAEQIRAELCKQFPQEFGHGYRYGVSGGVQQPCDAAGYPIGFREWPLVRRNAWWAGFNLGHTQREADHG